MQRQKAKKKLGEKMKYTKTIIKGMGLLLCILLFAACQQTLPTQNTDTNIDLTIPSVASPDVDAQVSALLSEDSLVTTAIGTNLLSNPSFNSGLNSWSSCGGSAQLIHYSSGFFAGSARITNGCFYQTVEVSANQTYSVSCQIVPSSSQSGWSGMGLGISNSSWNSVAQATPSVVSGYGERTFTATVRAPANSRYATLWFYSDDSMYVKDCTLGAGTPEAPEGNLLSDATFNYGSSTTVWNNCGTEGSYVYNRGSLKMRGNNSCVYQVINARPGLDYTLSCNTTKFDDSWASATMAVLNRNWQITESSYYAVGSESSVTVNNAPSGTVYAAVVLYGNGSTDFNDCTVVAN